MKTPFLNKQVPLTRWLHPEARKFQRGTLAPEVPMFRPPKSHTTFDMVHRDPGRCKAFTRLMLQAGPPPHNGQHINSPDLSPSLRCENCSNAVQRLKVLVTEMFKVLRADASQANQKYLPRFVVHNLLIIIYTVVPMPPFSWLPDVCIEILALKLQTNVNTQNQFHVVFASWLTAVAIPLISTPRCSTWFPLRSSIASGPPKLGS